jgi:hypothetical protein
MKNKTFLSLSVLAFAVVLLSACAKVPQVEIDNANLAVQETQAAGADVYVSELYATLQDSLSAATESIEAKNSKMFKNFKTETAQLLAVVEQAAVVKAASEAKIEALKVEIQSVLVQVATTIEDAKALVAQAPRGKEGNTALLAIKADIATVEASLESVKALVGTENYNQTLDKAKAVNNQIANIKTELETVIEKFNTRGKK